MPFIVQPLKKKKKQSSAANTFLNHSDSFFFKSGEVICLLLVWRPSLLNAKAA